MKEPNVRRLWTDVEDAELWDLMETEDASWEERAVFLPGRTAQALRRRYQYLTEGQPLPKGFVRHYTPEEDELLKELARLGIP